MKKGMLYVILLMFSFFGWAIWTTSTLLAAGASGTSESEMAIEAVYGSQFNQVKNVSANGTVYSWKKTPDHFSYQGFRPILRFPMMKIVKLRKLRKPPRVFILHGAEARGSVTISGLQGPQVQISKAVVTSRRRRRKQKEPAEPARKDVQVLLRYFRHWEGKTRMEVIGTDLKNKEQQMEEVPVDGDGGYCSRLFFVGPVDEVTIEAQVELATAYILIDEVLVGVGTTALDEMEEPVCD